MSDWLTSKSQGLKVDVPIHLCCWSEDEWTCLHDSTSFWSTSTPRFGFRAHGLCRAHEFEFLFLTFVREGFLSGMIGITAEEAGVMSVMQS